MIDSTYFTSTFFDPDRPNFDYKDGVLLIGSKTGIKSKLMPLNPDFTFNLIKDSFKNYFEDNKDLIINVVIDYMNTSALIRFKDIIKILNTAQENGGKIVLNWYYSDDDDDDDRIKEQGRDLRYFSEFKFNLKKL